MPIIDYQVELSFVRDKFDYCVNEITLLQERIKVLEKQVIHCLRREKELLYLIECQS